MAPVLSKIQAMAGNHVSVRYDKEGGGVKMGESTLGRGRQMDLSV